MGLITEYVEVGLGGYKNINRFKSLGYEMPIRKDKWGQWSIPNGSKIIVRAEDLSDKSTAFVQIKCDGCGKILDKIMWNCYKKYVREDGSYFCSACGTKLFGKEKMVKTKLEQSESFESWCISHKRQDVLLRWDYKLNSIKPSDVCYSSHMKYYFKCPREIHESELKNLNSFTSGQDGSIKCLKCLSFSQWGLDNIGVNFIDEYIDSENKLDIWKIGYSSKQKILIKCQKTDYHQSYWIACTDFIRGKRCPYCSRNSGKIHPLDSLGKVLENKEILYIWSNKNNKSPYELAPYSKYKAWWICPCGHKDYYRSADNSIIRNFRCPICQFSLGEDKIRNYLDNYGIIYIAQKSFIDLVGVNGGNLSYDFYLPEYNLLTEYQGEQHEKPINFDGLGMEHAKEQLKIQKTHDNLKREYAKNYNIKLLEIWYYDYDRIEEILTEKLNI